MQTPESQAIIERFFAALGVLVDLRRIRGKKTFTDIVGYDRRNFYQIEHDHTSDRFQVSWLAVLVEQYGISASWLLTGRGSMFR